jgi:hypothetical protein
VIWLKVSKIIMYIDQPYHWVFQVNGKDDGCTEVKNEDDSRDHDPGDVERYVLRGYGREAATTFERTWA